MNGNLFSLVLAAATGWALLLLGGLPVATLRRFPAEPLKAVGAWALVAATAPTAIFHWYLIFAVICLVACTKLDRPAGKIWLAVPAALGLSLGVVFPLETSLTLWEMKSPLALAVLYLAGATIGQAYVAAVLAKSGENEMKRGRALVLVLSALAWIGWLAFLLSRTAIPSRSAFPAGGSDSHAWAFPPSAPLWATSLVAAAAILTWHAVRDQKRRQACGFAAATALLAFVSGVFDLYVLADPPAAFAR